MSTQESKFAYVIYISATPERLRDALTTPEIMKAYGLDIRTEWKVGSPWRLISPSGEIADTGEIVELEPQDAAVKLAITHTMERPDSKLIEAVSLGWPKLMSNLKSLLETGDVALSYNGARRGSAREGEPRSATKVVLGNHASVIVPLQDRDKVRRFYRDVLGGGIASTEKEKDLFRLGDFYLAVLYEDCADESKFLRSGRSIWLEIKSDDPAETGRKILESGLVEKLAIPDPHLYFQAPGGQCLRLVGVDEDLSKYEGVGDGPDVEKAKEAIGRL